MPHGPRFLRKWLARLRWKRRVRFMERAWSEWPVSAAWIRSDVLLRIAMHDRGCASANFTWACECELRRRGVYFTSIAGGKQFTNVPGKGVNRTQKRGIFIYENSHN